MKKIFSDKLTELLDLLKEENMGKDDTVLIIVGRAADGVECRIGYSGTMENHINTLVNVFEEEGNKSEVIGRAMFKAVNEYRENHKTCFHHHPDEENGLQMFKRLSANKSEDQKPKKGESLPGFIARVYKDKPDNEKKFAMEIAEMITKLIKS